MDNIDNRILEVMAAVFEIDIEDIDRTASQDSVEQWDSLKHLDLVVSLEEEFGIQFPLEEIGNLVSFPLIRVIVDESY